MMIRYTDGSYANGVIHKLTGGTMLAVVAGMEDAIEFKLIRGAWTSDEGVVITLEFPIETGVDFLQSMLAMSFREEPAHCATGSDCVLRRRAGSVGCERVN